jgi:GNAT superfamily N-acetyltransferase
MQSKVRTISLGTSVRQLTGRDLPSVMTLSALAGWNQTEADWRVMLQLHPEGCLGIDCDGKVVATTTLICYGDRLAWLGMVLTHPNNRRRGFARHLVESALRLAEDRKIRSIKLDATDQGLPLYESLGFQKEQAIERWCGSGCGVAGVASGVCAGMPDAELDRNAFGADRGRLLKRLADGAPPFIVDDGFAMSRPGARAAYFGPCVARSPESAKLLIASCLSTRNGDWYWDLLPSNNKAVQLAENFGFQISRRLVRMAKGQNIRGNESMIYAVGGFELG